MRNLRTYYSAEITEFLRQSNNEILGVIHSNDISLMQPHTAEQYLGGGWFFGCAVPSA